MRFLIDENVPTVISDWLSEQGHDLLLAAELSPGESDGHWLSLAESDGRLIISADKDFGELVYRDKLNSHGVVLLRLLDLPLPLRLERVKEAWSIVEANPQGRFIVIAANRVRVRPLSP